MSNRYADWFRQAEAVLRHARNSLEHGDFEWSCFAAHQAAEKALKAVFLKSGMDAWGHTITVLIGNLPKTAYLPSEPLVNYARMLGKNYIPSLYPIGFESGGRRIFTPPKKPGMPFTRRRKSLNSVAIKSVNRDQIRKAVASFVAQMRKQHPEVERVIWFGSWVTGLPAPGSDVDLCLILSSSDKPIRDRIPDYLPLGFPVGIDLFAYTHQEFERLRISSPSWYEAITSGMEI